MIRNIAILITAFLGFTLAPAEAAQAPAPVGKVLHYMVTPCEQEDSINCYWDAQVRGNKIGHSYYNFRVGTLRCVQYWDRAYDRKHGYCSPARTWDAGPVRPPADSAAHYICGRPTRPVQNTCFLMGDAPRPRR